MTAVKSTQLSHSGDYVCKVAAGYWWFLLVLWKMCCRYFSVPGSIRQLCSVL